VPSLQQFLASLQGDHPLAISRHLDAVWYGLKGSWERAHKLVQDDTAGDGALVHAWLHRIEGDLENARYWYGQARRAMPASESRQEGEAIAAELLSGADAERGKKS
jgi:hypothetical protein